MSRLSWVFGNLVVAATVVGALAVFLPRRPKGVGSTDVAPPPAAEPSGDPGPTSRPRHSSFQVAVRRVCWLVGNVLIAASVIGAAVIFLPLAPRVPGGDASTATAASEAASMPTVEAQYPTPEPTARPLVAAQPAVESRPTAQPTPRPSPQPTATPMPLPTPEPRLPITRLVLPRIKLETDVVPSKLVDKDGVLTWDVPAFKAGHADTTVGAGQVGTAIIFGHVVTLHSGNVFENLHKAKVGDDIQVYSDDQEFLYRVTSVSSVPRDDTSILDPTSVPTLALITCTGAWNPVVWDYMERLIVRADLVPPTP